MFDFFFLISSQLIYHLDVMGREKKRLEDVKLYNFTIGKIIKKIFVRFVIIVSFEICFKSENLWKAMNVFFIVEEFDLCTCIFFFLYSLQ